VLSEINFFQIRILEVFLVFEGLFTIPHVDKEVVELWMFMLGLVNAHFRACFRIGDDQAGMVSELVPVEWTD
jgi:hypothetical protein